MFNIFGGSKTAYFQTPDKITPSESREETESKDSNCAYTVGVNGSGDTILKLEADTGTTTLTLGSTGTVTLIRLLEATLPVDNEDQ